MAMFQELPLFDVSDNRLHLPSPDDEYLAEDLLEATISGVRIVHHNVQGIQGIQSKIIKLTYTKV